MSIEWTFEEIEAVKGVEKVAGAALVAVAPFVAAREAAAFKRGLEAAAREVDCGCGIRDAVLERLESHGHKRASYLCSHGDVCCALAAAAIRALPIPEDKP